MKRLALLLLVGCTTPRSVPMPTAEAQASRIELALSVQVAAIVCSVDAKHLNRFSAQRSAALFDACTNVLIPARDAVLYGTEIGCVGKAVRLGLEGVQRVVRAYGYHDVVPGIRNARRVEQWAAEDCDPLHVSTSTSTYEDPNIARVDPGYP